MTLPIIVELHGQPRAKDRLRYRVVRPKGRAAFASGYTTGKTLDFERRLADAARTVVGDAPPIEGPIELIVLALFSVPASWAKKKREAALAGEIRPMGKPDWDNVGKTSDALNGIAWNDDSQIVDGRVIKVYDADPRMILVFKRAIPTNGATVCQTFGLTNDSKLS